MSRHFEYAVTSRTLVRSDVPLSDQEAREQAATVANWPFARVEVAVKVDGEDVLDEIEHSLDFYRDRTDATVMHKANIGVEANGTIKRFVQQLDSGWLIVNGEPTRLTEGDITRLRERCRQLYRRLLVEFIGIPTDTVAKMDLL